MEIEVGEYARDREGRILKILGVYERREGCYRCQIRDLKDLKEGEGEKNGYINGLIEEEWEWNLKHSKNLIDLIELRRLCKWRKSNNVWNISWT